VHYRTNTLIPYTYRQDLDFETMAKFLENNVGLPGLKAEVKPVRYYPFGALAAHILGYVGAPRDINMQQRAEQEANPNRDYDFYQPDMEGKAQIEQAMDKYLRGEPGTRILQRDVKSQILEDQAQLIPPKPGNDVYLTIDARLQYIVEDTLRVAGRAACVLVDAQNGDVLAMASVPSFDPNKFVPSIDAKEWSTLVNDDTTPLLNRAINGYAPGSTFKLVTSIAGLRAGVGDRHYTCTGGVSYGNIYMKCWVTSQHMPPHGTLDLEGGIKNSCNAFFFQYGNAAGIDQIDTVGTLLGIGQKSGLPLTGENPGILPGPEWLKQQNPQDRWRPGLTANVSIGQGAVLASPLQMAMVAAAIGNGGTVFYPRLIDKVVDKEGKVVMQEPAKVRTNLLTDAGINAQQLEHVRHGMWRVVNEEGGTARKARLKDIVVAGKTGTAQFWRIDKDGHKVKDNHVLFVAFAPYDKPKYAICVFIQGGKSGGGVAAPVAAKILEQAFALDKGELNVQVAALEPAPGNFKPIDSIDFNRDIPAAAAAEEVVDSTAAPTEVSERPEKPEAPSIRDEPDAEGRVERAKPEPQQPKKRGLFDFFNFGGGKNKPKPDKKPGWSPFHR
jgi:penicillin-binding protein 2